MFTDEISFAIMLCVSCGFAAWFGYRQGKQYALGAGLAASLLAGTWFEIEIIDRPINVTIATAIVLLVAYTAHSWRQIFKALHPPDYLIAAMMCWHIVVDVYHDSQPLAVTLRAYGEWMLPYAAGRYAFLHPGSMSKLAPVFVAIASFISVAAIIEAFTSWNLWEAVFVHVDDEVTRVISQRYGLLYRAMGPVRNPIFLGIVLVTMLPFAIDVVSRADSTLRTRIVGWSSMIIIFLGIVSTVSRGPILCVPLAIFLGLAWFSRPMKYITLATILIAVTVASFNFDGVMDFLEGGTEDHVSSRIINDASLDGPMIYNNTRHRLLIPRVYGPLVLKGGLFGYGTVDATGFPPRNIPGIPTDPIFRSNLESIDNSYMNVGLRFGWIGVALFVITLVATIVLCWRLAPVASTYLFPSDSRLIVAYACLLISLMFEIFTVFFCYDYSFWLLFMMGIVSGLAGQTKLARWG